MLIAYWDPVEVSATGSTSVGSIINYVNGLKIDFSLWSTSYYAETTGGPDPYPELDAGYRVLVDKTGLTSELPAPTYRAYIPTRPDEPTFQRLVTDFLIGVPYVAKGLLRDQLLPTRWVIDVDMRYTYLVPMLEWRVQCDHDWSLKAGNLGKDLKSHLSATTWSELEKTFANTDPDHIWAALFAMINLFARVADEVAAALGYASPRDFISRVAEHAHRMQDGDFAHGRV